jgi:xanthine dehydrogenase accessory factor
MFPWKTLLSVLEKRKSVALLYVLESKGSSPGRQGFRLFVESDGTMHGTIGGGIMEQKLVELAKSKLAGGPFLPFVKRQIHSDEVTKDRSGMICSGEQTVAFYYVSEGDKETFRAISSQQDIALVLDETGISTQNSTESASRFEYKLSSEVKWRLKEGLSYRNTAYIFGGGHVGLAMSRTMSQLGFRVVVFDNREGLNTLEQNIYADEKHIIPFEKAELHVPEGDNSYVIIMSFGYKTDGVIIRRLLGRKFRYIGLMGSQQKIDTLWQDLRKEGYSDEDLMAVHSPIGVPIHSKTTDEIAISIAAEIIRVKNEPC